MALETNAVIIVLVSIVFGALLGELLKLEAILNWFGEWVTSKFKNKDNSFNIGQGFVTASLIFGVGAMAILGSLDSGLRGDHELLMTKAVLWFYSTCTNINSRYWRYLFSYTSFSFPGCCHSIRQSD